MSKKIFTEKDIVGVVLLIIIVLLGFNNLTSRGIEEIVALDASARIALAILKFFGYGFAAKIAVSILTIVGYYSAAKFKRDRLFRQKIIKKLRGKLKVR